MELQINTNNHEIDTDLIEETDEPENNECRYEQTKLMSGGIGRSDFSNSHQMSKIVEKSISAELAPLPLPDDVKQYADRIFQQLETNTKRGKRRRKLIFYCILTAYNLLKKPQDPKIIAEIVGIADTEMTKAVSMCSELQTKFRAPTTFRLPTDFIPEYAHIVGISESSINDVMNLGYEILEKDKDLLENYPQVVAAGIILYYLTINGVTVNKREFAKIIKRSEMTISKMYKRIMTIHNS